MTTTTLATEALAVGRDVLDRLESAWNTADGTAFASAYAEDASFVTVRGEHIHGRAAIGAGHDQIFGTIYAGSVNRMELVRAEEVAAGVVLLVSLNTLTCPAGPLAGEHRAFSTNVVTRTHTGWSVLATSNCLVRA